MLMIVDSIVLGLIQGITEFLPISSSGHLILVRLFLGGTETEISLLFDLILHLVTALVIAIYFHKEIWSLVCGGPKKWLLILVGIIPAGFVGYIFGDAISNELRSLNVVILMLIIGSMLMIIGEMCIKRGNTIVVPKFRHVFIMGLFQVLSLIPGTSRSGSTIAGGLVAGLTRKAAATYSFLLGLPLIVGVALLKTVEIIDGGEHAIEMVPLIFGGIVTFISGFIAIHILMKIVTRRNLWPFIWYRFLLASILIILQIVNVI